MPYKSLEKRSKPRKIYLWDEGTLFEHRPDFDSVTQKVSLIHAAFIHLFLLPRGKEKRWEKKRTLEPLVLHFVTFHSKKHIIKQGYSKALHVIDFKEKKNIFCFIRCTVVCHSKCQCNRRECSLPKIRNISLIY